MSTASLKASHRWRSLTFALDDGQLVTLADDEGGVLARSVTVSCAEPWVADPDEFLTWRLAHDDGVAELRGEWQCDDDELRLQLSLSSAVSLEVPGPLLAVESVWPVQRLRLSPRHSALLVDAQRRDGAVLVLAAQHRAGDWGHRLDGSSMQLSASRLPRQLVWRARFGVQPETMAGLVPSWLPTLMADAGDEITLGLPDAGVVAESLDVVTTDWGSAMGLPPGRHAVTVHEAHETTELVVWARRLDPSPARSAAGRALAALATTTGTGVALAEAELEEALHAPGEVSPLLVAATATLLSHTGSSEHRELLLDALPRLADAPGRVLAQVRAAVALAMSGDRASAAAVRLGQWRTDDPVLERCLRAEVAVLTGADQPTVEVRAMCALWGRGLPIEELAVELVAPWLAVWRHAPEGWRVDHGWLLDQAEVAEWARVRMQLDEVEDSVDWLLLE